ncbi:hypothetical protein LCI18_004126 [Fusarium solani-melongenae]|uniref:Uncharacterized protein n=1 Tax=Fusarium solani subsp. cucurbitae TaxID=2747967 RepID=A0ACD3YW88_FUSSC|nr:hypothetical protein LCI18_004126 [Fusarium solani-melongenae]
MIASYLVRESAMITAKNQSMFSQASDITVDLAKDVYVSYSVVDGYHLVLSAKKKSSVENIRIFEDHLGIRFAQFLPSSRVPVVKGWWRDLLPPYPSVFIPRIKFSALRVESDGVKLKRITDAFDDDVKYQNPHIRWPSPEYPSQKADLMLYNYIMEEFRITRNIRMTYFDCNAPGVTGYTMVCQGHSVSTIHAHGKGHDTEFYKEIDTCFSDQVVVYMPVDQGEYVTEIERRWMNRFISSNFIELVFTTNRARHTIFGSDKEGMLGVIRDTIMKPSPQGSRIYFNKIDRENEPSVRYIACDKAFEEPIRRLDLGPLPSRLKEVTLCRDVSPSHRPVIGMLVQYTDDHRECLGQFRFDKTLKTIQADQSGGLHISLQMREDEVFEDEDSTYVADVYGFPLGDPSICPENESWIEASWSGTLEWKFRSADSTVTHIPVVQ